MSNHYQPYQNSLYRHERGSTLALTAVVLAMLLGFMGVAIYLGLQAYVQNELQKAATTATLAGAANYYQGFDTGGNPVPDAGLASSTANAVFTTIVANSPALQFLGASGNVTGTGGGIVSMTAEGTLQTPLLSLININEITVEAEAHAISLMYSPTAATGSSIQLNPSDKKEFTQNLDFPLLGGLRFNELKVEQQGSSWKGWAVTAGSGGTWMNLMNGATALSGDTTCRSNIIYGSAVFDLDAVGVNKAGSLRFVDDLIWDSRMGGCGNQYIDSTDNYLLSVEMLGYSAACPTRGNCPTPMGLQRI